MTSKFSQTFIHLLLPFFVCAAGIALIIAPYSPGDLSNIVAWLETDGGSLSLFAGSALIVFSIVDLVLTIRPTNNSLRLVHGKLTCIIEQNVMKSLVEQILAEYFNDTTLHAEVFLKGGMLHIFIEMPPEFSNLDTFTEHLRDKLYLLTGYYGEIHLSTRTKASSSV